MKKKLLSTLLLLAAFAATADDVVITYQTGGEDKYADGVTVLPNEFYALVWSSSDTFGGYNANGKLKNSGDKQLGIGPDAGITLLGNMGLSPTYAVVDGTVAQSLPAGYLHVVMLDTRNADETLSTPDKVTVGTEVVEVPSAINGYEAKGTVEVLAGLKNTLFAAEAFPITITCVSGIPNGAPMTPVVKNLYFEGEGDDRMMVMVVTNTASYLRYTSGDVALGSADLPKTKGAVPANGGTNVTDEIVIRVPAADTNRLFRVIRN